MIEHINGKSYKVEQKKAEHLVPGDIIMRINCIKDLIPFTNDKHPIAYNKGIFWEVMYNERIDSVIKRNGSKNAFDNNCNPQLRNLITLESHCTLLENDFMINIYIECPLVKPSTRGNKLWK